MSRTMEARSGKMPTTSLRRRSSRLRRSWGLVDAPALAHPDGERVHRNDAVRRSVEGPAAEGFDLLVERLGQLADLRLRDRGDAEGLH